jgi:uncharacterized protein (TIGR03000 family)
MRLSILKATVLAAIVALAAAAPASATWWYPRWYSGYYPYYGYSTGSYYYPYATSYYSYNPYTTSYYSYYPYASRYIYSPYYYYTYPSYSTYTPTYVPKTVVATAPASPGYRSYYPPSDPAGNQAEIRVLTAPDATLWFDGFQSAQLGTTRTYTTPELKPGKMYSYQVKVRWTNNGVPVEKTKTVAVSAGETVDLDLMPQNLVK